MAARLVMLAILSGCHFSASQAHDSAVGTEPGLPGAGYFKVITVASGAVPTTVANFPMWIDLVDPDLAAHAAADGADIYFMLPGGAKLDYEIERWDPSSGTLAAWVRVPMLAGSMEIELHYGDPAGAIAPNASGVFGDYAAVWHLSDPLSTPTVVDSTGTRLGAAQGLGPMQQVTGKLAGGIAFDGSTKQITFANPLTGTMPHTISAWVQQGSRDGSFDAIVALGTPANQQARFMFTEYTQPHVAVGFYANDWNDTGVDVTNTGWTLLHWVFDGQSKSTLFRNGMMAGEFTHSGRPNTTGTMGAIGYAPTSFGANNGLVGVLDEVRIAPAALTAARIAAEFANQSNPSTFYTVGPEQVP